MKYTIFIFFVAMTFLGCKNDSKNEHLEVLKKSLDTVSINDFYSYSDYRMFILKKNKAITYKELCEIDSIKVQMDVAKNKLAFFSHYSENRPFKSLEKMSEVLKEEYHINTIEIPHSCIINDSSAYAECYEKLMRKAINKKHGDNFIDKIKRRLDSIYYYENRDKVYSSKNSYAMFQRLISDDYQNWRDSIRRSLFDKMVIPKNIGFQKDEAYISVEFVINENGTIDSLESYTSNVPEKHQKNLEEQVKKHVQEANWLPFEAFGVKLKSKEHFFLNQFKHANL